jgi:hypothetical protein
MDTKEQLYFISMIRAISDENRLAMLRMMAQQAKTITEMAQELDLPEAVVTQYATQLHANGFLRLQMVGNQRLYRFQSQPIKTLQTYIGKLGEPLTQSEKPVSDNAWIDALDCSADDKKILVAYTFNGKLTDFPTKDKQWFVILRWLASKFEVGVRYSEKQVNAIITEINPDYATLRRMLVEFGFMSRERGGGDYWLTPKDEPNLE